MRLYAHCFMTVFLIAPLVLYGQEHSHFSDPNLLGRLSFDSGGPGFLGSRRICIAVDQDGSFWMMRTNEGLRMIRRRGGNQDGSSGAAHDDDPTIAATTLAQDQDISFGISGAPNLDSTERLEGTLSPEQLLQFETLVGSSDLRPLAGIHVGLIRQSAETFTAEIPTLGKQVSDRTLHVHLINADGQNPFPAPVRKLVDWLNRFEPTKAKRSADLELQDVCPSRGFQLLQPTFASNAP